MEKSNYVVHTFALGVGRWTLGFTLFALAFIYAHCTLAD
jgi:hypothetical protein